MFKSDANAPGEFDTAIDGDPQASPPGAPRTRSLTYYSTDPFDAYSDQYTLNTWSDEFGQTFVATGDRIVACSFMNTIGWLQHLSWQARILEGGPGGTPVGPWAYSRDIVSDEYWSVLVTWPVDANIVTPGQTYYLQMRRVGPEGMNTYYTNDNYPNGNYYYGGVSDPDHDLMGFIVAMNYGTAETGAIDGHVYDAETNEPLSSVTVTAEPGGAYDITQSDGSYHITLSPGTYSVTATLAGYQEQTISDVEVTAGEVTVVDFYLQPVSGNLLTSPGFESGDLTGWSTWGNIDGVYSGPWFASIMSHSGDYFYGAAASYGTKTGGLYQTVSVAPGQEYDAAVWTLTYRVGGNPGDVANRLGVDPTGGTDPESGSIQWTPFRESQLAWVQLTLSITATSSNMTLFLHHRHLWALEWCISCFDDAFLAAKGAPPQESSTSPAGWLKEGWNLISLPLDTGDTTASEVLQDLVDAGNTIDNNLYTYQVGTGYLMYPTDFTTFALGSGYWLYLTNAADATIYGDEPSGNYYEIPLSTGWNLIGFPWRGHAAFADCQFSDGVTTYYSQGAIDAGWIQPQVYYYDGVYKVVSTSNYERDDWALREWRGYWILVLEDGITMRVPKPAD